MRCLTCHYSLANLTGPPHRCPECGRVFDPKDPRTYGVDPPASETTAWVALSVTGGLILFGLYLVFIFTVRVR